VDHADGQTRPEASSGTGTAGKVKETQDSPRQGGDNTQPVLDKALDGGAARKKTLARKKTEKEVESKHALLENEPVPPRETWGINKQHSLPAPDAQ